MAKPSKEFLENTIYLIDASSYIFRAYYAVQTELLAPDGTPTHATHAFINMIRSFIKENKVQNIALIWDRKEKGFRHEIFPEYKANRGEPPEDLSIQIENTQKIIELMGIPQYSHPGFEADDVIATAVEQFNKENIVVVTSDKDLLQLVSKHTWCLDTMKKKWSNHDEAVEKFGVEPEKVVEVQALCGDSVDNIPGAPGIGPKTASALINEFGSLDKILKEAKKRHELNDPKAKYKDALKGKKIENIAENLEKIELSLKLVALRKDVPLELKKSSFQFREENSEALLKEYQRLGFKRLTKEVSEKLGVDPAEIGTDEKSESAIAKKTQNYKTIITLAQLKASLQQGLQSEWMSLDTETKGLDVWREDNIVGFSYAFNDQEGFYVPLQHLHYEKNLDSKKALKILEDFLIERSEKKKSVIFQNAKFDLHIFQSAGLSIPENLRIDDTMVASYVLDSSESHGMDQMALKYLDGYQTISFSSLVPKGETFANVSVEEATPYAAEDAIVTWRLWEVLSKKLEEEKVWNVYDKIDRPIIPILTEMEKTGVALDVKVLNKLSKALHDELESIDREAREMLKEYGVETHEELNFASPKQIAKILYEDLQLPILKKGKTGPSTDVSVLEELSLQHPFPKMILEVRELSKLLSTYVDPLPKMIDERTGRLHAQFSQTTAQTGRFASSNPNLQNIPIRTERGRKIRDAFCAAKGKRLIGADYSQVELRVLAHYSQDEHLLEAFEKGADIHKNTASKLFNKDISKISDDERRVAKTINFGIVFGQTAFGLAKTLGIGRKEAQEFIDQYFKNFPGIKKYMEESIKKARESGRSYTLAGRYRKIRDINSKNPHLKNFAERMSINSPIQGTAADMIKLAMIKLDEELKKKKLPAQLVLQVHDELIFEAPEEIAKEVEEILVKNLEANNVFKDFGVNFKVKMKADSSIGEHWGEI